MISTPETGTAPALAGEDPKANKKARVAPQGAHVGKKKAKSAKKTTPTKKAPKTATKPKGGRPDKAVKEKGAREGSKTNTILDLLKRPGGSPRKS